VSESLLVRQLKCCWLAIAALLWCSSATALNPDLTIKELHHTAWGPSQGAPLGGALALAQTNDGYLWIASRAGCFDSTELRSSASNCPTTRSSPR
jgi:ligand-binding sensor domain-containing protein